MFTHFNTFIMYNVGFYERKINLSICLFWTLFDMFTFLGEKAKLVTAPVKIFIRLKIDQCSSP